MKNTEIPRIKTSEYFKKIANKGIESEYIIELLLEMP